MVSSANTAANVIQSIAGTVGSAFVIYITVTIRKGVRKFMGEHDWIMKQTKENTEAIKRNSEDITRILHVIEQRHGIDQRRRR